MPQATNLVESYNNFAIEPLIKEEQIQDFYVNRPKEAASPIKELKYQIENAKTPTKHLFLGFRGCGKSTELNKLGAMFDKNKFLVIHYSIREELNTNDFDFKDFFVSMALKIFEYAEQQNIELKDIIKQDFLDFIIKLTHVSEEEIQTQRGLGVYFSKFILLKLKNETKTRETVRRQLEMTITDLIQKLNFLILEVQQISNKSIVVAVDDLDKLTRGQQAEDFFYQNYNLLLQPKCFVIYTFPIPLTFNPCYENVRQAFDSDVTIPQVPVKSKDGTINEQNVNFYKSLIEKRVDLKLIDENALQAVIFNTGKISELVAIMRDLSIKALGCNQKISLIDVNEALEKLRRVFDRTLTQTHKNRLIEIYQKKETTAYDCNDSISRDLLFNLSAVEYEDKNDCWCDVNLLLIPLVEKWIKNETSTQRC
ncbi:MAG: hypothetical protein FWH37_07760 [Candidatus Bathyarchaeota archaeon]|nr:hypothetical protein [Candidatus Termiticorpusculum sp.]